MVICIKNLGIQFLLQNTKIIEENILQHIAIEEKHQRFLYIIRVVRAKRREKAHQVVVVRVADHAKRKIKAR